jgi:hypothetical protein
MGASRSASPRGGSLEGFLSMLKLQLIRNFARLLMMGLFLDLSGDVAVG